MSQEWRLRAACRCPDDLPVELRRVWTGGWFPEVPDDGPLNAEFQAAFKAAVRVCEGCEVRLDCALYAREFRCYDGVWGGLHGRKLRVWIRNGKRRVNSREEGVA